MCVYRYSLYQFQIESEIRLPCQEITESPEISLVGHPEPPGGKIIIQIAPLRSLRSGAPVLHPKCYRHEGGLLIETPHGVLKVDQEGKHFLVDASEWEMPVLAQWFVHLGLAYTLVQQGCWPIHAAGLQFPGTDFCVGIMARSGTGKSTLAWHWIQKGALFGADDLLLAYLSNPSRTPSSHPHSSTMPLTYPSRSLRPKISEAALTLLDCNLQALQENRGLERAEMGGESPLSEYLVSLRIDQRQNQICPLKGLCILRPEEHRNEKEIIARRISILDAQKELLTQVHGLWLFGTYLETRIILERARILADYIPIWELSYKRSSEVLDPLCEKITELCISV